MYKVNPLLAIDSYKLGHMTMYPECTTKVYCNITPRDNKRAKSLFPDGAYDGKVVVFGISSAGIGVLLAEFSSVYCYNDMSDKT